MNLTEATSPAFIIEGNVEYREFLFKTKLIGVKLWPNTGLKKKKTCHFNRLVVKRNSL